VVGDKRVRFGLGAIRNVGRAAIDSILAARAVAPFASLFDLCDRVDLRLCNKRVFEAMIASGALDSLGGHRAQFLSALDSALQEAGLKQDEAASGQGSLFGLANADEEPRPQLSRTLPNISAWSDSERLAKEKEILGFYISGHPLEPFRTEVEIFATHSVSNLGKWVETPMFLGVVVTAIKKQVSKRSGSEFARLTVEDFSGSSEVLVFPEAWALLGDRIKPDIPVLFKGGYSKRDQEADNPTFIVESVTPFTELRATGNVAVSIELAAGAPVTADVMHDVREMVDAHAGSAPIELRWNDGKGGSARLRSKSLRIAVTNAALTDLRALLGTERVRLVRGS
jgi:DNA polymerase III, alpha subunit